MYKVVSNKTYYWSVFINGCTLRVLSPLKEVMLKTELKNKTENKFSGKTHVQKWPSVKKNSSLDPY